MWPALTRTAAALAMLVALAAGLAADQDAAQLADDMQRLAQLQQLVGAWRGVGQPQRGSNKDSWVEEADWAWSFGAGGPALVSALPKAKYFKRLVLRPGEQAGNFVLTAQPASGGAEIVYSGTLENESPDQQQLVLTAKQPRETFPERLSFRFVAEGNRLLILLEKRGTARGQFARMAEVGYTRQGSGFGKGAAGRLCIVTGGLGTIPVVHNGQTYYVCCTGCRDYFTEHPEKVLAEDAARKSDEK